MSLITILSIFFFFSSRRRHTRLQGDWSSDVCSSDLRGGRTDRHRRDLRAAACSSRAAPRSPLPAPSLPSHRAAVSRAAGPEIGRAAGRGRGEVSVVAGSLKKKKKKRSGERLQRSYTE